jgi:hypothetical protein
LESLCQPKRTQLRYTHGGVQGFFLYYADNGVDLHNLIEHAVYYPQAVQGMGLQDLDKARQFSITLTAPASAIYAGVLAEQKANRVNDLEDILKAYVAKRMGEHGQRAAYRQVEGLNMCAKPRC